MKKALKMVVLVPIALAWDIFFGVITVIYEAFAEVDKRVGALLEEWMRD
mgnify:CR=1 FL=1